jgi:hypothetical protein
VVANILRSAKYRGVAPSTVRDVDSRSLVRTSRQTEAQARRKLHLIVAEYHAAPQLRQALADITQLGEQPDEARLEALCAAILSRDKTSAERLPLLEQGFCAEFFAHAGRPMGSWTLLPRSIHSSYRGWNWRPARKSTPTTIIGCTAKRRTPSSKHAAGAGPIGERFSLIAWISRRTSPSCR